QEVFLEDELGARVVRGGVDTGIHADGVARARLHAETAEHAPELVDDEPDGIALVATPLVADRILPRFDVDALGRASRGAAKTRDAARGTVVTVGEPVNAAKALWVGASLFGIGDRIHAVADAVEHGVVALPEHHLLRVAEEVGHRDTEATRDLRHVALDGG